MTEDEELQNPEQWDFENADLRTPVKEARAVVSVAFARTDLDLVVTAARKAGMKVSEYIRTATLRYMAGSDRKVGAWMSGSLGVVPYTSLTSSTGTSEAQADREAGVYELV